MARKKTVEEWLNDFYRVHGKRYRYYFDTLKNSREKMKILCFEHGDFWQSPEVHLVGSGCPSCGQKQKNQKNSLSHEDFLKRAKTIHGDRYSYPEKYKNSHYKIRIICPIHGEFLQKPNSHLNGRGCPKCSLISRGLKSRQKHDDFLLKARKIHGNKYIYPEKYISALSPLKIICPIHGEFYKTPSSHISLKAGCFYCYHSLSKEELKKRPKLIYKISCKKTNLSYIGCTINTLHTRYEKHWSAANKKSNSPLHIDMLLYGQEAFSIQLLKNCSTILEMLELEKKFIIKYNTLFPSGYNRSFGGEHKYKNFE